MLIKFVGDIHGSYDIFHHSNFKENKFPDEEMIAIQVGDFGFYPGSDYMDSYVPTDFPVYFIDGNHEHFAYLKSECERVGKKQNGTYEVRPNLFYVPRGTILDFHGTKFGFLGGAESINKYWLRERVSWFHEERITDFDVDLFEGKKVDMLVAHCPPTNVIYRNFPPLDLKYWELPAGWVDVSAKQVEKVWGNLGMPKMVCGHFHKSVVDGPVTILDINEVWDVYVQEEFLERGS